MGIKQVSGAAYWFELLHPDYLEPDCEVRAISCLDADELKGEGIKALIFDADQTICGWHGTSVDGRVADAFANLTSSFSSCLLSNAPTERRNELHGYFGIPVVDTPIKKPMAGAFKAALELLKTQPHETAMIGDRLLTDITGAKALGIYTIKVHPLYPFREPWRVMLARGFENMLWVEARS
ncbi:HAD-IA family hydrolase [Candidatus Woesearchaeota archaeon]|nr:HAD-IA family hydrolase [Candidatus Woesearchaeota archaeon]